MATKRTTPAMVRAELKRRGLPYDIYKTHQAWWVVDGDAHEWESTGLYIFTFDGLPASEWVDRIEDMAKQHAEKYAPRA